MIAVLITWYYTLRKIITLRREWFTDTFRDVAMIFLGASAIQLLTANIIDWRIVFIGLVISTVTGFLSFISFTIK